MSWITKTFRPNYTARKQENKAQQQNEQLKQAAAQASSEANALRAQDLNSISIICQELREETNSWYQNELRLASEHYQQNQEEYAKNLEQLEAFVASQKQLIELGYQELIQQLAGNKEQDLETIELCLKIASAYVHESQKQYQQNTKHLDQLRKDAQATSAVDKYSAAFAQLKQSSDKLAKTRSYTLLIAYFKELSTQGLIADYDLARYCSFLAALYNNDALEHNCEFTSMDAEIKNIFAQMFEDNQANIDTVYQTDLDNFKTRMQLSTSACQEIHGKLNERRVELDRRYEEYLRERELERDQKIASLMNNRSNILQDYEVLQAEFQHKHQQSVNELNACRDEKLQRIQAYQDTENAKVEALHDSYLQKVQAELRRGIDKINSKLALTLSGLRRSRKYSFINLGLSIGSGIAAVWTGGLFNGASIAIKEGIRNSLRTTSLGAATNLVTDKDKLNLKGGSKFSYARPDLSPASKGRLELTNSTTQIRFGHTNVQGNLMALRQKFTAQNNNIDLWQKQSAHRLMYPLYHSLQEYLQNPLNHYQVQQTKTNYLEPSLYVAGRTVGGLQVILGLPIWERFKMEQESKAKQAFKHGYSTGTADMELLVDLAKLASSACQLR